jgi:hypothetical protein
MYRTIPFMLAILVALAFAPLVYAAGTAGGAILAPPAHMGTTVQLGAATSAGPSTTGVPTASPVRINTTPMNNVAAGTTATVNTDGTALPPPPPAGLTQSPARAGVPAVPAPPDTNQLSASLQTSSGLNPTTINELRPPVSLNATQVIDVQATLAAGGLYSGPLDGVMSGATRAAIAQYQDMQRLPVTGQLDGETISRLDRGAMAVGSNGGSGSTATSGSRAATPLSSAFATTVLPSPVTVTNGPTITSGAVPFPLSVTTTTSPLPPPGTTIQP